MELYDVAMIGVLSAATLWGFWKGVVWQIASLASLVASYFLALKFADPLATYISQPAPWNKFLAMLGIYLGTSFVIWIGFRLVKETIDLMKMREFDRQLGLVVGAAKGILLCVVITFFAVTLPPPMNARDHVLKSKSGTYIALLLQKSDTVMPPELHTVLDPYIQKLEQELDPMKAPLAQPAPFNFGQSQ